VHDHNPLPTQTSKEVSEN